MMGLGVGARTQALGTVDSPLFSGMTIDGDLVMAPGGLILHDVDEGLTASIIQVQGQGLLAAQINEVSVVANLNDAVTLLTAETGRQQVVVNNGANDLQIFPASGDNLGAGIDQSTTLEPNETVMYRALDNTDWSVESTQLLHAEMAENDNTDAFVVSAQNGHTAYHSSGLARGDLGGGWAFDVGGAGVSVSIASIADGADSGVDIAVTTGAAHGLVVGAVVSQTNVADAAYSGNFLIKAIVSATIYEVEAVFTATDTGTMDNAAILICPMGGTGTYLVAWSCDGTPVTNNETFDFAFHVDGVHQSKTNGRSRFGTAGDIRSLSNTSLIDIVEGQRVSWMVRNTDSAGNITIRNLNIILVRL